MRDKDRKIKQIGAERSFLNKPFFTSLSSNISYTVTIESEDETLQKEGLYNYADIGFGMSDCNRTIFLDFRVNTEEDYDNCQYKLDRIIEVCQAMKKDLDKAYNEVQVGVKRLKEIKDASNIKES